jgi:hypothetical protein
MIRKTAPLLLAAALAAPAATASAADPMPTPDCHGIQVTDKTGDSVNGVDPSLGSGSPSSDLVAGWFTYDPASNKATANIQVANLTLGEVDPPYDAISWEFQFTAAGNARYVRAFEDISGATKFNWGAPRAITDDQTQPSVGGATTGKLFPGPNGVIQIDVPLKDMNIAAGTTLKGLALEVRQWDTFPAATPALPVPVYSVAPIYDSAAGKTPVVLGPCTGPAPVAPAPASGPTASAPAQPARLAVKVTVPKLSAKKVSRKHGFSVKLSGTASKIVARLRQGNLGPDGKVVGSGSLAKLKGKGTLKIKVRGKVRKGAYTLELAGRNADGSAAQGAIGIKLGA